MLCLAFSLLSRIGLTDTIVLKNGIVYRGAIDKDNTIIWLYDGLKRVVIRDSKIARIETDSALLNPESFDIVQPLEVHGGSMPKDSGFRSAESVSIRAILESRITTLLRPS